MNKFYLKNVFKLSTNDGKMYGIYAYETDLPKVL